MRLVLGIDEAGRGPIIGSLFICGALFNENDLDKLKELGVKDSKLLSNKTRFELEKDIKKIAKKIKIIRIKPEEIDNAVEDKINLNLNWLEAIKTALIINELNPDKAIVDCPSVNIKKYKEFLLNLLKNKSIDLVIEHKADLNHVCVSAASIMAKCKREEEISDIKKKYGDIGSGYPSDPSTQKFLKENGKKYPEMFRKSWSTWKKLYDKNQKKLDEFSKF